MQLYTLKTFTSKNVISTGDTVFIPRNNLIIFSYFDKIVSENLTFGELSVILEEKDVRKKRRDLNDEI